MSNLCECGCGQIVKPGNRFINGHNRKGKKPSKETRLKLKENNARYWQDKHLSKETKIKISDSLKGEKNPKYWKGKKRPEMSKENNPRWNEDCDHYDILHYEAYKKFGLPCCEICGISNDEYFKLYNERFSMHNTLNPKDYTMMESYAWQTLCRSCHQKIESKTGVN